MGARQAAGAISAEPPRSSERCPLPCGGPALRRAPTVAALSPPRSPPPSAPSVWSQIIKIIPQTNKRLCLLANFQINRAVGKAPRCRSSQGGRGCGSSETSGAVKQQHSWQKPTPHLWARRGGHRWDVLGASTAHCTVQSPASTRGTGTRGRGHLGCLSAPDEEAVRGTALAKNSPLTQQLCNKDTQGPCHTCHARKQLANNSLIS